METVVQPPADAELHLLTEWNEPGRRERTRTAAIGSVIAHAALIAILMVLPAYVPPVREVIVHRTITPLIEPPTPLTQKDPNTAKVTKEFNAADVAPRPRIQLSQGAPSTSRPAAPRPAVLPPMPAPKVAQPTPLPEPPKLEAKAPTPPPKIDLPAPAPPVAAVLPQILPEEKKSIFENVAPPPSGVPAGRSQVPIPGSPVAEAVRQAARNNTPGGVTVGDQGGVGVGGVGGGLNLPPAPGARGSNIQLLSDPMGVDFRPYLTQILATVRRNWMAVMPESVRLGRRGQVAIQFSIARDGKVPKLVIANPSGADTLDRAAVAGISASTPFPPLPAEFKGDRVVLQFNFTYNMPRQ
jgi:TonB family protein